MVMKIEIELNPQIGDMTAQLHDHLAALGYQPSVSMRAADQWKTGSDTLKTAMATFVPVAAVTGVAPGALSSAAQSPAPSLPEHYPDEPTLPEHYPDEPTLPGIMTMNEFKATVSAGAENLGGEAKATETTTTPQTFGEPATRVPGQPSPGRKRRTKEEMAEDEAYFAARGIATAPATPESLAAISTGEERISPEDEADERAEADTTTLTIDDIREAVGRYTARFGIATAQRNVPLILGCAIVEVPDTQEAISEAIAKIDRVTQAIGEPEGSVIETKPVEKPVLAAKDDVHEALLSYAMKYDGTRDVSQMKHTLEDGPRILSGLFGPEIRRVAEIPATPEQYGAALTAINKAILDNPFNRKALK